MIVRLPLIRSVLIAACAAAAAAPIAAAGLTPAEAIRAAIAARVAAQAAITVDAIDWPATVARPAVVSKALLDPAAVLGRPIRVTLVPARGQYIRVVAAVRVVADVVKTTQPLERGATVSAGQVQVVHEDVAGVPLRRLLSSAQIVGGRVLRPIPAGAIVLPGSVVTRRAVEPGDAVTAVAATGAIEVSASLVAVDGGDPGTLIRVMNPDTHRDLRGRVIKEGLVEVAYGR
jgi:flagella basal body P-ring formation protein FlgA